MTKKTAQENYEQDCLYNELFYEACIRNMAAILSTGAYNPVDNTSRFIPGDVAAEKAVEYADHLMIALGRIGNPSANFANLGLFQKKGNKEND